MHFLLFNPTSIHNGMMNVVPNYFKNAKESNFYGSNCLGGKKLNLKNFSFSNTEYISKELMHFICENIIFND